MPHELYLLQISANFLAIVLGPVTAVCVTLWFQSRKEKLAAKRQLFLSLMAERKNLTISPQVAQALNTIDVVFSDNREIVGIWHKYYALLAQQPSQERDHTWLELLSAMAKDLRYPGLSQTDLDKFYLPQSHVDQLEFQKKAGEQWLRVLENTKRFLVEPRDYPPST